MKRIPTLFGSVKCVFMLAILLFVAASTTVLNEAAHSAAYWAIPNWTNELSGEAEDVAIIVPARKK